MSNNKPKYRVFSENYISKMVNGDKSETNKKSPVKKNSNSSKIDELLNDLVDGNFYI